MNNIQAAMAIWLGRRALDGDNNPGKPIPEVGRDHSDVVAAGPEHGKEFALNMFMPLTLR